MTKISIIMPVYNGAKWLEESIHSVLEQTFTDFELICINDSSTDNSEEMLNSFTQQDSRIKYYSKKNEGPGLALNYGIKKATGKYLCFLDQDDKYDKYYLEKMYNSVESNNYNMSICNAAWWNDEDNSMKVLYPKNNQKDIMMNTASKKRFFSGHSFPQWTKIIKREFFIDNNIEFPDRENKAHDVPVHYLLIGLCDKVGYVEDCIYYHRHHPAQISYNFDSGLYFLISINYILNWLSEYRKNKDNHIMKSFLLNLFKLSTKATVDLKIQNELIRIVKNEYSFIDRIYILCRIRKSINKIKSKKGIQNLLQINSPNVGNNTYCATQPFIATNETKIGKFVSIGANVRIGHGEHPLNFLSTSPYFYFDNLGFKAAEANSHNDFGDYEPVQIDNDVWIGDNVSIKNGIKIGNGAVIGMGSIVTKDIPPYAVVAGIPAKIIKYRFDELTIKALLKSKWWDLDIETIKKIPYDDIEKALDFIENIKNNNAISNKA